MIAVYNVIILIVHIVNLLFTAHYWKREAVLCSS